MIWVNYNDLTVLPSPGIMVNKGYHPKWPNISGLWIIYTLPRYDIWYMYTYVIIHMWTSNESTSTQSFTHPPTERERYIHTHTHIYIYILSKYAYLCSLRGREREIGTPRNQQGQVTAWLFADLWALRAGRMHESHSLLISLPDAHA